VRRDIADVSAGVKLKVGGVVRSSVLRASSGDGATVKLAGEEMKEVKAVVSSDMARRSGSLG